MAKRKVVDAHLVEVKDGEYKYAIFGWCATGEHEGCRVEFPGHKCLCECHGGVISD